MLQWPYAKRSKTNDGDESNLDDVERAFHDSLKPSWGPDGTLVYAAPADWKPPSKSSRAIRDREGLLVVQKGGVISEARDVRFARFSSEVSLYGTMTYSI